MPIVTNPNVVRVAIDQSVGLAPMVNVLHFLTSANPDEALLTTIASGVYANWTAVITPLVTNAVTFESATAYSMASDTAPRVTYVPATPETGDVGQDPLPLNVAGVITWRSSARGRSGRGRTYVGGFGDAQAVGSNLLPSVVAALQTAAETFRAAMQAAGIPLIIYSTRSGGLPRATGLAFPVLSGEVRTGAVGSQRDRVNREAAA